MKLRGVVVLENDEVNTELVRVAPPSSTTAGAPDAFLELGARHAESVDRFRLSGGAREMNGRRRTSAWEIRTIRSPATRKRSTPGHAD
jgi:hypothetical protein